MCPTGYSYWCHCSAAGCRENWPSEARTSFNDFLVPGAFLTVTLSFSLMRARETARALPDELVRYADHYKYIRHGACTGEFHCRSIPIVHVSVDGDKTSARVNEDDAASIPFRTP
eukprot:6176887-Pleurochrysis_carterae.AAC.1